MRNPWGFQRYNYTWHAGDSKWNANLKSQVPFGFDPTSSQSKGMFVVPMDAFKNKYCFNYIEIGHMRDDEGFVETWYDVTNDDESYHTFTFTPTSFNSDIYFTVETYFYNLIPLSCTTGTLNNGQSSSVPASMYIIRNNGQTIKNHYYLDYSHRPTVVSGYNGGDVLTMTVQYDWVGSPHKDFTVKVYSKQVGVKVLKNGINN